MTANKYLFALITAHGLVIAVSFSLGACATHHPPAAGARATAPESPVTYASTDLGSVSVFSKDEARLGSPWILSAVWAASPARYFETDDDVQCVSVGPPIQTREFAIKRPIRAGERYKCLQTSFRVTRCFEDCQSAIVEVEAPIGGAGSLGTLKSYLLVDSCLGILVISETGDLSDNMPRDAEWLRGAVGILPDKNYPGCNVF